jgi:hypothetical protein
MKTVSTKEVKTLQNTTFSIKDLTTLTEKLESNAVEKQCEFYMLLGGILYPYSPGLIRFHRLMCKCD